MTQTDNCTLGLECVQGCQDYSYLWTLWEQVLGNRCGYTRIVQLSNTNHRVAGMALSYFAQGRYLMRAAREQPAASTCRP
jgi:hypothetical protein